MALEVEALNSPSSAVPLLHHEEDDMDDHRSWTKRKRTKRSRLDGNIDPSEEEYLALCLLMLAQGGGRGGSATHHKSPPPPPATGNSYLCTVCHRGFPSYQALGGHKGSHKGKPGTEDQQTAAAAAAGHIAASSPTRKSASVNSMSHTTRTHQCSVCLKTFASGQALGGHKRRHFEAAGGSNSSTLTEDAVSGQLGHRGFDLNLPASPEQSREANSVDFGTRSQLSCSRRSLWSTLAVRCWRLVSAVCRRGLGVDFFINFWFCLRHVVFDLTIGPLFACTDKYGFFFL